MIDKLSLILYSMVLLAERLQTFDSCVDDSFHRVFDVVFHKVCEDHHILVFHWNTRKSNALQQPAGRHPKVLSCLSLVNILMQILLQVLDDLLNHLGL